MVWNYNSKQQKHVNMNNDPVQTVHVETHDGVRYDNKHEKCVRCRCIKITAPKKECTVYVVQRYGVNFRVSSNTMMNPHYPFSAWFISWFKSLESMASLHSRFDIRFICIEISQIHSIPWCTPFIDLHIGDVLHS